MIKTQGLSETVLEVSSMERAVSFWSKKLGFPIVEEWSNQDGQIWATWLYVGGNSRIGLWIPRNYQKTEIIEQTKPISQWNGLFDEGGVHVHLALYIHLEDFEETVKLLVENEIDLKIVTEEIQKRVYFKDTEENIIEFYTLDMKEDFFERLEKGSVKTFPL